MVGQTKLCTWTAKTVTSCIHRHNKNICLGTVSMDMESDTVWRVVETKACARWGGRIVDVVTYIKNFEHLDCDPDINDDSCEVSLYDEVKEWHKLSRAELSLRSDLQPASGKMICIVYCNFHHPYTRPHSY